MSNGIDFEVSFGGASKQQLRKRSGPLQVLVLADLSGGAGHLSAAATTPIDIDNLDGVLARTRPSVQLDFQGPLAVSTTVHFESMDDFHPDQLERSISLLTDLRDLDGRLSMPATEAEALAELAALLNHRADVTAADTKPTAGTQESDADLLERLLGSTSAPAPTSEIESRVQGLVRKAFANVAPGTSDSGRAGRDALSEVRTHILRSVLGDRKFRSLERSWRSLHWLVSRIDETVARIHVCDISKAALLHHVQDRRESLERSTLFSLLADRDTDVSWDLILGDYTFRLADEDLALLSTLGDLLSRAGVPFVAQGDPSLFGCDPEASVDKPWEWSLPDNRTSETWGEVRRRPSMCFVGLATPRFLLRYPYGAKSDPIESWAFEELPSDPDGNALLWANPAFACAAIVAEAHATGAAAWPVIGHRTITDLPTPQIGSGAAGQAPLEYLFTERAQVAAAQQGFIVFSGSPRSNQIATPGIYALGR